MGYTLAALKKLSFEKLKALASTLVIDADVEALPTRADVLDVLLRHAI